MQRAGERPAYSPVYYVEPFAGNQVAFGFDLASNPTRRAALHQARDSGGLVATGRITLVQESGKQHAFLVLAPIYRNGQPHDTVAERRQNLAGYAVGVFRIGAMLQAAFAAYSATSDTNKASLDLHLYDEGAAGVRRLLYASHLGDHRSTSTGQHAAGSSSAIYLEQSFEVAGRTWAIEAAPENTGNGGGFGWQRWLVLFIGLTITALLAAHLKSALNRARAVERLVEERTVNLQDANQRLETTVAEQRQAEEALRESEGRIRAIVESAADGIVTVDDNGVVTSANAAAGTIFDYPAEDLEGTDITTLAPDIFQGEIKRYLVRLRRDAANATDDRRETNGRRRNGTTFPFEFAVSAVPSAGAKSFTVFLRDITERKAVERMKNEFVSTVSPELRTPLTSIYASLGLIAGGLAGELPAKANKLLDIAHNNCERLVRLINDILDIEKIESGKIEYHIEVLDLIPLIEHVIEANHGFAQPFDVKILLDNRAGRVHVRADSDCLIQVLTNLISNACKFSPPHSVVEVNVRGKDNRVRVAVSDHGPGIPEEFRDRVFEKFAQADSSDSRQKGGTGLGLCICRAIIEGLKGNLDFETETGKGTTFYFELPQWREARAPALPSPRHRPRRRILVCGDDLAVTTSVGEMLRAIGCDAECVSNAEQARSRLAAASFASVLISIDFPDHLWIYLVRDLRARHETRALPIMVLGGGAEGACAELRDDGFSDIAWLEGSLDRDRLRALSIRRPRQPIAAGRAFSTSRTTRTCTRLSRPCWPILPIR